MASQSRFCSGGAEREARMPTQRKAGKEKIMRKASNVTASTGAVA
jgi:hypothetical protein